MPCAGDATQNCGGGYRLSVQKDTSVGTTVKLGLSMNLGQYSLGMVNDPTDNKRCAWWQQGLYL